MIKHLTLALTCLAAAPYAIEAAATNPGQSDNASLRMEMETKLMALTTVMDSMNACTAKKGFYTPTDADADADGCTFGSLASARTIMVDIGTLGGNELRMSVNLKTGVVTDLAPSQHHNVTKSKITGTPLPSCPEKLVLTSATPNSSLGLDPEDGTDASVYVDVTQHPTCENGYVAILRVKDTTSGDNNDTEWSLEGRFAFLIVSN